MTLPPLHQLLNNGGAPTESSGGSSLPPLSSFSQPQSSPLPPLSSFRATSFAPNVSGEIRNIWNNILTSPSDQQQAQMGGSGSFMDKQRASMSSMLNTAKALGQNLLQSGKDILPDVITAANVVSGGGGISLSQVKGTLQTGQNIVSNAIQNPDNVAASLIHGTLTSTLEAITNRSSADSSPLSPEQRAGDIQNMLSLIAAHKVGMIAREDAISSLGSSLAKPSGFGNLARVIAVNTATGGAAGGAQAAVANLGNPNYIDQVVGGVVVGGGLGGLIGGIFPKATENALESAMLNARDVAALKTISVSGASSIQDALAAKASVLTSDNLGEAIINAKILKPGDVTHITGLSPETATAMETSPARYSSPSGANIEIWKKLNKDGSVNVIASADPTLQGKAFFQRTGLLPNQNVSYLGKDYTVKGVSSGTVALEGTNGKILNVDPEHVRSQGTLNYGLDKSALTDKLYQGMKDDVFGGDPTSFDPSTKPGWTFDSAIGKYISKLNLSSPSESAGISKIFQEKLTDDLFSTLDPVSKKLYYDAASYIDKAVQGWGAKNFENLARAAISNGMDLESNVNGITIKDIQSGKPLHTAPTISQAFDYIAKSPQLETMNLDAIQPQLAGKNLYPLYGGYGKPFQITPDVAKVGLGQGIVANARTALAGDRWSPVRIYDYAQSVETNYPEFKISPLIDNVDVASRQLEAAKAPHLQLLNQGDKIAGVMTDDRKNILSRWMETASDANLRPIRTDAENSLVDKYAGVVKRDPLTGDIVQKDPSRAVDTSRYFRYYGMLNDIQNKYSDLMKQANGDPVQLKALGQQMNQDVMQAQNVVGMDKLHLDFHAALENVRHSNESYAKIFPIIRGINSIIGDHLSREDFAVQHSMTPAELNAGATLDKFYQQMGDEFGIDPKDRIFNFMTHARNNYSGDIGLAAKKDFGNTDFYAALPRTGLMDSYEMNPFAAARKYMNAGMQVKYLDPAIGDLNKYVNSNLPQLDPSVAKTTKAMVENYANRLVHKPTDIDQTVNTATRKFLQSIGLNAGDKVFSNVVSMINGTVNTAAFLFRPVLGLWHFANNAIQVSQLDGIEGLHSVLEKGFKATLGDGRDDLVRRGVLTETSPYDLQNLAGSGVTDKGAKFVGKMSSAALKTTGLKQVNDVWQSGIYLHYIDKVAKTLQETSDPNMIAQKVNLRTFDVPARKQFLSLIGEGKNEQAADFLGRQALQQRVGTFDQASNPALFQNSVGRLFGQFGNYPSFIANQVLRTMTNGTLADSFARATRYAALTVAIKKAEDETGLNLSKLNPLHAFSFQGGPSTELLSSISRYVHGNQDAQSIFGSYFAAQKDDGTIAPHLLVPGSFSAHSISGAIQSMQQGANPFFIAAQAIGIPQSH